ncbi:unnamed protein product [Allacma fusca]|uniref:WH1 domain-containing protein n=1 Tax=Allacma fusca TaxID=39272 RepID=A0A8J2K392_9HEXA|nr:unnamed protein product [Allacma fusca]
MFTCTTTYNKHTQSILGTRIGQASECFVYWKDPVTSDTWGLNFTSPIDAKQFRECCDFCFKTTSSRLPNNNYSPAFKFSRKASSSYSLRLDSNGRTAGGAGRGGSMAGSRTGSGRIPSTSTQVQNAMTVNPRRRPLSTPTSPSKAREPQCTCMTAEQYARLRAMDPRFRAASTLPRANPNQARPEGLGQGFREKVSSAETQYATVRRCTESKGTGTEQEDASRLDTRGRSTGRQHGREIVASKSVDYSDTVETARGTIDRNKKNRSKSTDDVTIEREKAISRTEQGQMTSKEVVTATRRLPSQQQQPGTKASVSVQAQAHAQYSTMCSSSLKAKLTVRVREASRSYFDRSRTLPSKSTIGTNTTPTGDSLTDSHMLKRLLKPMGTTGSVATSPELSRRTFHHDGYISEPEIRHSSHATQMLGKRPTDCLRRVHEKSRGVGTQTGGAKSKQDSSPPSDQPVFDHAYYATTPPSSSPEHEGNSPSPGSPTARLLLEYEQHLRNTLAKGMDAESYSLHTFEAIISQSNENLSVPPNSRSTTLPRFLPSNRDNMRVSRETSRDSRDSDGLSGYYSDFRERDRDRGYLSDHNSRNRF